MKKRLITSALPYVNNIPHLGNLIQVLSADVFTRFCRLKGYETLYICGTDEYGTATETKALEEGISPQELCDRYNTIHADIYKWFNISFDRFGRTSTAKHTEIVQDIFLKLDAGGYIKPQTIEQLYCENCCRFLADRYVRGTCPVCGYAEARGDQCENCGKLLDPTELIEPKCGVCGGIPEIRRTEHLYIDLPAIRPILEKWIDSASVTGFWARNAVQMTRGWIRDGLKERCITRDLKWGIPVPKERFRDKVFYVWFDACIGYISITANHTGQWEEWWKNPAEVELFQFIGKDNIPFHTVIFPSSLLGTGERWTMLHHMSSTEYLNYESGKFSKSKGVGVFGNDVMETGIPADVWRFYIYYNRPEKADSIFIWKDFQEKVNGELIGNLANLVNRTLTFVNRYYDGKVPQSSGNDAFWETARKIEKEITELLDKAELRDAFRKIFALSSIGNKAFQDGEPWRTRTSDPASAACLIHDLVYLIKDLAILIKPYMPATSEIITGYLGHPAVSWEQLGVTSDLESIQKPEILFKILDDEWIEELRLRFSGTLKERGNQQLKETLKKNGGSLSREETEARFRDKILLKVAKIVKIQRHPAADKLYIETITLGDEERQIVSGLVPYYTEEELLNRNIILAANLKPAKLRGVVSQGMLLAAEDEGIIEVLFADHANPGSLVTLEGDEGREPSEPVKVKKEIIIDDFFSIPIRVEKNTVYVGNTPLVSSGKKITTEKVSKGKVG
ncbi:MAG: methionine--tRNA ligase [Spirochaetota bacterium]